jgi:hypothetical protein
MKNRIILALTVLNLPTFANKDESLNNDKLTQYVIIANSRIPKLCLMKVLNFIPIHEISPINFLYKLSSSILFY